MKRVIFVINVANQIDLITNSSSELFTLQGKTKEVVEEMLKEIYPDYRSEYAEIINVCDLDVEELDNYFSYACSAHMWPAERHQYPVIGNFTFDELYQIDEEDSRGGRIQYKLRNNVINPENKWDERFVTEVNKKSIIEKLSPNKDLWFLFSLDENPDWDMQERLMGIGQRYHLG